MLECLNIILQRFDSVASDYIESSELCKRPVLICLIEDPCSLLHIADDCRKSGAQLLNLSFVIRLLPPSCRVEIELPYG